MVRGRDTLLLRGYGLADPDAQRATTVDQRLGRGHFRRDALGGHLLSHPLVEAFVIYLPAEALQRPAAPRLWPPLSEYGRASGKPAN